jgi:hypothetical protein
MLSELHDLRSVQELSADDSSQSEILLTAESSQPAISLTKAHAYYQRLYGLRFAFCMVFNCILRALDSTNTDLDMESMRFCNDALGLADQAALYRPLGAGYVALCLVAVWCCSRDERAIQAAVEGVLIDHAMDFPMYMGIFKTDLEFTSRRLSLL